MKMLNSKVLILLLGISMTLPSLFAYSADDYAEYGHWEVKKYDQGQFSPIATTAAWSSKGAYLFSVEYLPLFDCYAGIGFLSMKINEANALGSQTSLEAIDSSAMQISVGGYRWESKTIMIARYTNGTDYKMFASKELLNRLSSESEVAVVIDGMHPLTTFSLKGSKKAILTAERWCRNK